MPAPRLAPEPELYGVLGDMDAFKQLVHKRDSEYLSRYPSFHPTSVVGSSPSSDPSSSVTPPSAALDSRKSYRNHSRRPSGAANGEQTLTVPAIQVSIPSAKSWIEPNAEEWHQKPSYLGSQRPPPPRRAQPVLPVEVTAIPQSQDPLRPQPGITISEPKEKFARARGPRKSAMKNVSDMQPSLPQSAYLSPEILANRKQQQKYGPPNTMSRPPVATTGGTPYWMSPAPSHGRLSSAATSHGGSSVGTSSVAFTSSSYYSSAPSNPPARKITVDEGEPVEELEPRRTLFVVNADPDPTESEPSPVIETKPSRPLLPYGAPKGLSRKRNRSSDRMRTVPPVPPLPIQFQAPPPPSYPPPVERDRSRSDPTVPGVSKSNSDRERAARRNVSETRPPVNSASKPIRIPSTAAKRPNNSSSDSESSSSSSSPYTPETSPPTSGDDGIPAEWVYPMQLTLEELFKGGKYTFRITTRLLSGEPKSTEVEIDVKPGWKTGTRIIFPNAGNERKPGVFQDMIFVVEQLHHERFARLDGGRLVLNQDIDYAEAVKGGQHRSREVVGLDGASIKFYPPTGIIKPGQETVIKGHGMYLRSKSQVVGRGDLVIRWNVCFPSNLSAEQVHQMRSIFNN